MRIRRPTSSLATAVLLVTMLGTAAPTQDLEKGYGKIGWWSITHRKTANLSGCDAVTTFPDHTMLAVTLIQIDRAQAEWVVLISNPKWDSRLQDKSQHELWLVTTKRWDVTFGVSADKKLLFIANPPVDFINSIADARSLMIFDTNNNSLTSLPLSMKDSAAAIKAVQNCAREHSPTSPSAA